MVVGNVSQSAYGELEEVPPIITHRHLLMACRTDWKDFFKRVHSIRQWCSIQSSEPTIDIWHNFDSTVFQSVFVRLGSILPAKTRVMKSKRYCWCNKVLSNFNSLFGALILPVPTCMCVGPVLTGVLSLRVSQRQILAMMTAHLLQCNQKSPFLLHSFYFQD